MVSKWVARLSIAALGGVSVLVPVTASAQAASGIAGVVKDTSGAVLPGVTVEASSPALIEKVRSGLTDGEGRYNIVDLRPGTYVVSFSLNGFTTVRREGIELTSGFTATVNADLMVGSVAESVTVTAAAPLVDVQNVRRQTVVSDQLLAALPTSTKNINNLVTVTPGFAGLSDVGGRYTTQLGGLFHGKDGTKITFDGMGIENTTGALDYQVNAGVIQEMVLQTSGISADTNADGPVANVIPKEGGNKFSGALTGFYAGPGLESSNLTDELRLRGLTTSNKTTKLFDESASLGGPIKKDKLWFFFTGRSWGFTREYAGVYWNKTQDTFLTPPGADRQVVLFTPWTDRPLDRRSGRWEWYDSFLTRMTWQAATKNKISVTWDEQRGCNCGGTSAAAAQESSNGYIFEPTRLIQGTWNSPHTNRLLLEAAASAAISQWNTYWSPGVSANTISINDIGLGKRYGASSTYLGNPNYTNHYHERASVSYVTGSHAFKTGFEMEQYYRTSYTTVNGAVNYTFRTPPGGGLPAAISITQFASPYSDKHQVSPELGVYGQDVWTLNPHVTLNLGVRFDYVKGSVPSQDYPGQTTDWAGAATVNPWIASKTFGAVDKVPSWKDISPRLGLAWDLLGNGRTALKVSAGRYVAKTNTLITQANQPLNTSVISTIRGWTDSNHNFVPDCDLGNLSANGECQKVDNLNFGQNNPKAIQWADGVLHGLGARDSNWDFTTEVQHKILSGLSVSAGYFYNNAGYPFSASTTALLTASKVRVADNLLVTPADYSPYCITVPLEPRLPNGGGYQLCGLADVSPLKFGQNQTLVRRLTDSEQYKFRNDFFNASIDARVAHGLRLGGGVDTGRSVTDHCFVVDSPQELLYCRVVTPFKAQTQFKVFGSVPLPLAFVASFAYQNLSGPSIGASYAATNTEIKSSLGRDLAGGLQSVTVPLVAPQTLFSPRIARLDVRLSKIIETHGLHLQVNFDAYNALNSSTVLALNNTFGTNWQRPTTIMDPRIIEIGGQISF